MTGETFCLACPLVVDRPDGQPTLTDQRVINFYTDGKMIFRPESAHGPDARDCGSTNAYAKVDQEADPYRSLMAMVGRCAGPESRKVQVVQGFIGHLLSLVGIRKTKTDCPAALEYFDPTNRGEVTGYFDQQSICMRSA